MRRKAVKPAAWAIPAAAIILLLLAAGCRRSAGGVPLNSETGGIRPLLVAEPAEPVVGPVRWRVTLLDEAGAPIEGASVSLRGDMTHAGMTPVEAVAADQGGGVYLADAEWTMAGDWIVTVSAVLPDGLTATERFTFGVDAGP